MEKNDHKPSSEAPSSPETITPSNNSSAGDKAKTNPLVSLLTILALFVAAPIGLIVMWAATRWKMWIKIVITLLAFAGFLLGMLQMVWGLTGVPKEGEISTLSRVNDPGYIGRDVKRRQNIHLFSVVQDDYMKDSGSFLTSDLPYAAGGRDALLEKYLTFRYKRIYEQGGSTAYEEENMRRMFPTDPGDRSYTWVDNTMNDQKYCVYADLEVGGMVAISQDGFSECSGAEPTLENCCVVDAY